MGKNLSQLKSPSLRKCMNPKCDYYYFGYKYQRYCCGECARIEGIAKSIEHQKMWRKNNIEYVREYYRKRYHKIPLSNTRRQKQRGYSRKYHEKNKEMLNKKQRERYYKIKSDINLWKIRTTNKAIYYREKCLKNKSLTNERVEKYKKEIKELKLQLKTNRSSV